MEVIKDNEQFAIIRLAYGEELREKLESFCAENGIKAAWFNAIGATKEIDIAVYNLEKKQYDAKIFSEMLEIVGISGNISIKDDGQPRDKIGARPFMHAHGIFGRPSMEIIGGHINKCVISATCEIKLQKLGGTMTRKSDDFTGLHLLCQEST